MTRVLVVEDSQTQAARVRLILEAAGFAVETASNGEEGFARCLASSFDLVLTDVLMPRLSGYDLCRRMKAHPATRRIPVVLLTTLRDPTDVIEGLACGAENFLTKPYEPEDLVGRVRNVLANARLSADRTPGAGVEIVFMGRRFVVDSEKEQILGLLVSTFEDVVRANRDLVASQAALAQAEREAQARSVELARVNQALEAFVYTVSHDLKAPLRGIQGFGRLLRKNYAAVLDEEGRSHLDLVCGSAERMHRLIDDLLAFARIGRARIPAEQVPLGRLLREVVDGLRFPVEEAGASIRLPPDLPVFSGYPALLRQLFENLLGNALKYRRPGVAPAIDVAWRPAGDEIEITVSDNGIGVPPDQRERVFGLFQRLHREDQYPGTGVGLAICKRIVEEHGGTVAMDETPGGGCTIHFRLRAVRADRPEPGLAADA